MSSDALPDPERIRTREDFFRELRLAWLRTELTIDDLANATHIARSTLGGYLSGENLPAKKPPGTLRVVLNALGITDPITLDAWDAALTRARRRARSATVEVTDLPAPPVVTPPVPTQRQREVVVAPATLVSIRPPVDRLDQGPTLRGREELLERLGDWLDRGSRSPTLVLHGLGGIGKTTLALAAARAAGQRGVTTWWVSATDQDSLLAGMQALAVELGAEYDQVRMGSSPDLVWRLLEAYPDPWLLVIDNADPRESLSTNGGSVSDGTGWIRRIEGGHGRCLVTTDDGSPVAWGTPAWLELIAVGPMSTADGTAMLMELAPRAGSPGEAATLAERLAGLPFALHLAGRSIAKSDAMPPSLAGPDATSTFAGYLRALDQRRHGNLLDLARVWDLSLKLASPRERPLAGRAMLRLLACLGPGPVNCNLLRPAVLSHSALMGPVDGVAVWDTLQALRALGIVKLVRPEPAGDDLVVTHPLVRELTRRLLGDDGYAHLALLVDVLDAARSTLDPKNPRSWSRWQLLADHSTAALDLARELGIPHYAVDDRAYQVAAGWARYLHAAGELARADAAYERVARLAKKALGDSDHRFLEIRHLRGRLALDRGLLVDAKIQLDEVLTQRRAILGPTHPDTLTTQHYLARTLRERGEPPATYRQLFHATMVARRATIGSDHPDTLTSRNNVADIDRAEGRFPKARAELEAVYRIRVDKLGTAHPATLVSRYNLARLAHDTGDLAGAAQQLSDLLTAYTDELGPDHPRTLLTRQAQIDVWCSQDALDRAEHAARALVADRRRTLGEDHPATLETRFTLAVILIRLGRHRMANLRAEITSELLAVRQARTRVLAHGSRDIRKTTAALNALSHISSAEVVTPPS